MEVIGTFWRAMMRELYHIIGLEREVQNLCHIHRTRIRLTIARAERVELVVTHE